MMPSLLRLLALLLACFLSSSGVCLGQTTGYLVTLYTTGIPSHHTMHSQVIISDAPFPGARAEEHRGRTYYIAFARQLAPQDYVACCEFNRPYTRADSLALATSGKDAAYDSLVTSAYQREEYWAAQVRTTKPTFTVRLGGHRSAAYVHQFNATLCPCWRALGFESHRVKGEWKNTGRILGERFVLVKAVSAYHPVPRAAKRKNEMKRVLKQHFKALSQASTFPLQ